MVRGKFRLKGDTLEVFPSYEEAIFRVEYFGDEVERILKMNPVTGEVIDELGELWVYPASHYVTGHERMLRRWPVSKSSLPSAWGAREQGEAARSTKAAYAHRV